MAQGKENTIEPINVIVVNWECSPDRFLKENPHLAGATVFVNNESVEVFKGIESKLAYFIVLIGLFHSPIKRVSIGERFKQAAKLAGYDAKLTGIDIKQKDGKARICLNNFLILQQDFHHQYFIKYEIIYDQMMELVYEALLDKTIMENEDIIKFMKEIRESQPVIERMRESNFGSKVVVQDVLSRLPVEGAMPTIKGTDAAEIIINANKQLNMNESDY